MRKPRLQSIEIIQSYTTLCERLGATNATPISALTTPALVIALYPRSTEETSLEVKASCMNQKIKRALAVANNTTHINHRGVGYFVQTSVYETDQEMKSFIPFNQQAAKITIGQINAVKHKFSRIITYVEPEDKPSDLVDCAYMFSRALQIVYDLQGNLGPQRKAEHRHPVYRELVEVVYGPAFKRRSRAANLLSK